VVELEKKIYGGAGESSSAIQCKIYVQLKPPILIAKGSTERLGFWFKG